MKLTITFPHPPSLLSLNGSMPTDPRAASARNRARIGVKMKTRDAAFVEANQAMHYMPQRNFPAKRVEVLWYYKGIKPDVDGIVTRCKALLDGCAKAFGVDDRDFEDIRVRRVHTLGEKAKTVDITFDTETETLPC